MSGRHHNLCGWIDCGGLARGSGSVATLVNHATAGDDAVRIFREASQLGEAAAPVPLRVGLVPDFPILDMGVCLQVGSAIGVGSDCRNPSLPDGIGSAAIAVQINRRIAFSVTSAGSGGGVMAG